MLDYIDNITQEVAKFKKSSIKKSTKKGMIMSTKKQKFVYIFALVLSFALGMLTMSG